MFIVIKSVDSNDIIILDVMKMFVVGYKAFNKDLTNRYGDKFEVGKSYCVLGDIKWGNDGNGFHLCINIEDCFRYFDSKESVIAEVIGFGELKKYDDEYYGYYDMYVCEKLKVVRLVSREEIFSMVKNFSEDRLYRFVQTYDMTDEESAKVEAASKGKQKVLKAIRFYHYGDKDVYKEDY